MPRLNGFLRSSLIVFLVFTFVVISTQTTFAFPRKVLFEDFTNTGCPPCGALAPILEEALEATADVVVPQAIHVSWPDGSDPWYLADRANNNDQQPRVGYYDVRGVPTMVIDGEVYQGTRSVAAISNAINNAARSESPLAMEISASIIEDELNVHIVIEADDDVPRSILQVALLENYFHYPQGRSVQHNYHSMLTMMPNASGTNFSAESGEVQEFDFQADMNDVGFHELPMDNLSVIAWVQNANRAVYQTARYMFPAISVSDWSISDLEGNGDGRPGPGETGALVIEMTNSSPDAGMENLIIEVTCDDEGIAMDNNRWEIDVLNAGAEVNNSNMPFTFNIPEEFEANRVTLNINVMDGDENSLIQLPVSFTAGWPEFLLVDASNSPRAADEMRELFGDAGLLPFADYYNRSEEGMVFGDVLANYNAVFWFTFNAREDVMDDWEEEEIMGYLNNGGTFILSSQFYARRGEGNMMRDFMRVELDEEDVATNYIHGIEDEPYFSDLTIFAGGQGGDCAGFPDFRPSLTPLEGANVLLQWGEDDDNLGAAAVEHVTDTYKTLFLAFPLESVGGFIMTAEREEVMDAIWNWHMGGDDNSAPGASEVPVQFALNPSYPNPFNAATVIPFGLDKSGSVNLSLYDMSGRVVGQLFNGMLEAGSHTVNMNGGELGLTTGLYLVRLNANGQTAHQRVLYLK